MNIVNDIKLLLDLFEKEVPDIDSNRLVRKFCDDKARWYDAHGLFKTLRDRNLKAIKQCNKAKECQYCFEEVVAKTLYNLTRSSAPFDPDAPYWVLKNAFVLAESLNMPPEKIIELIA
jgi:hypothetical protein